MDIQVRPVDKEIEEDAGGTAEIDEEIEFSGAFKPDDGKVPVELKGSKDLLEDAPEGMREFMEALGGKQTLELSWDLKRK